MTAETGTLTRTDTGTHAVVRVLDPGVHESVPYSRAIGHLERWVRAEREAVDSFAAWLEGQTAQAAAEMRQLADELDLPPVWAELPGTELPRRQHTADDIAALLGVDLLVKARWDLEAMRNPDAVARVNEGLRRLWPVQPDSVNEPEPDPVAEYMAADDPDERPGRTVVLPPTNNPLAQAYARTAGHAQRQDAIRRAAEQGTATGQYVAPALRPRGPRNPIARQIDGLFARVETWWRAKQAQRDQRMGVGE